MPNTASSEVYQDIQEKVHETTVEEDALLKSLFEYTEPKMTPWRARYLDKVSQCIDFKELRQWTSKDETLLAVYGVPPIPSDRINRGLDNINGAREQTANKKKIVKQETGDERIASILDTVYDRVAYDGDFSDVHDDVFEALLDTGMGIAKIGYDPQAEGGQGACWAENVNIEDFASSKGKSKELKDINWCWQKQVTDWETAAEMFPLKAGEIKGLRTMLASEWDKLKQDNSGGVTDTTRDYRSVGDGTNVFPDQVELWEFWKKRIIPAKKIAFVPETDANVQVRTEPIDYTPQQGELELANISIIEWWQYIAVSGENKNGAFLVSQAKSKYPFHPYVSNCSQRKRSGEPRGYIEVAIPHQQRINLAWAQKEAWNNKSLKSALILKGAVGTEVDSFIQQTRIGSVMVIPQDVEIQFPQIPQVNLQAIEEGNSARADLDFAASATEAPLRGISASGDSGVKFAQQANIAMTPLNKWVKADSRYLLEFARKVLHIIIMEYPPERMARVVGEQKFIALVGPQLDPTTGQMIAPPLQLPLQVEATEYDVRIEDKSLNDFKKQQSFNSGEALVAGGVLLDDPYRISNSLVEDKDEAIASNQRARNDVIKQLLMQVEILKQQMGEMQKQIPKQNPNSQGPKGKAATQAGKRSMTGGQNR